jgi:hypothetical protein
MSPWAIDKASSYVARSGEQLQLDEIGGALRRMLGKLPRGLRPG